MTHRAADVGAVVDFSFMRLVNMVDIYDEEPRSGVVRKVDPANPGGADSEKAPKQVANVLKLNNNALVGIDNFSTVLVRGLLFWFGVVSSLMSNSNGYSSSHCQSHCSTFRLTT